MSFGPPSPQMLPTHEMKVHILWTSRTTSLLNSVGRLICTFFATAYSCWSKTWTWKSWPHCRARVWPCLSVVYTVDGSDGLASMEGTYRATVRISESSLLAVWKPFHDCIFWTVGRMPGKIPLDFPRKRIYERSFLELSNVFSTQVVFKFQTRLAASQ